MTNYWVSWWHLESFNTDDMGFEIHSPWWISGQRGSDGATSICAAIKAESEESAKAKIIYSYDITRILEFRFCEERPDDWTPFSDRFPKRDWMQWNATIDG